jgi:hypothetical protein
VAASTRWFGDLGDCIRKHSYPSHPRAQERRLVPCRPAPNTLRHNEGQRPAARPPPGTQDARAVLNDLWAVRPPPYQLLARSGAAWVLLATHGSGSVWVRRDELEGVVDVATPFPTEQPIVIANEQQRAAPTALAATAAPATPAGAPPAPAPTVPRTIVYRNADGSVLATYSCQPYGDWRDSDPMYVHPECSE